MLRQASRPIPGSSLTVVALLFSASALGQAYPPGVTAADFDHLTYTDFVWDNSLARLFNSFSRANCLNNESLTYYLLAQESRAVFSAHYRPGVAHHYVTENPIAAGTCHSHPSNQGGAMLNGQHCLHTFTTGFRHPGIHGSLLPTEPSTDTDFFPSWTTRGTHSISLGSGLGGITVRTVATD